MRTPEFKEIHGSWSVLDFASKSLEVSHMLTHLADTAQISHLEGRHIVVTFCGRAKRVYLAHVSRRDKQAS